jgi:aminomethyltransferase
VRFDKGEFRGRAALVAERERGISRRLRGLLVDGRQIPRQGCAVLRGGEAVGEVTSGNFSPTLERGIALAFVPTEAATGDVLDIDIRGRRAPATVTELPFVRR